ncbi:putative BED-type domain-containing protein [Seiridium cardinale]|uniref:BED-type domain-containing protein n=1 Tax=Seiridium cardinale TaxID=138064 RepID=A0ABR2XVZ2_9PEZI
MFDSLQWSVDSTRKRAREDDEAMSGTLGFTEHRNKRLHSLPLRTSPSHKRWSGPPSFPSSHMTLSTITPSDSDSEDMQQQQQRQPASHFSPWSSSPALSQQQRQQSSNPLMDADRDTDMMVMEENQHLQPGPAQPDPIASSITGRMPTPIHATFAAQVRGNSWGATNGSNMHASAGSAFPRAFAPPPDASVPRTVESVAEWSMVQNRRLPSPISESGGEEPPISPGMVLDSSSSLQRPYLPHMPHSTNPSMAHPNVEIVTPRASTDDVGMMDTEEAQAHSPTSAPATPSPRSKFGHSRSKHTLNSWTLQPGMKKSFSIGYRADCEKCRLKIPGHFNHIIVS